MVATTNNTNHRALMLLLSLLLLPLLAGTGAAFAAPSQSGQSGQSSYAFVRSLEGTASLYGVDAGYDQEDPILSLNSPLRSGDRIRVDRGSRAEVVLPDQTVVRLDGGADLTLNLLALAADRDGETSRLQLQRGEIQLVVPSTRYAANLPRVDTPNSTVYVGAEGVYRVSTDGVRTTEVVVRQGSAEVVTPRGSATVRRDEMLIVSGLDWPQLEVDDAGQETALERWGRRLDEEVAYADLRDIDEPLRYGAARLSSYGGWVSVGNRRAWRPARVSSGWRPYVDGRWVYTPSGLTWVSNEPWGWATYHYGTWDYAPGYGWAWFPGNRYSPAWVYWYWGPTYTGWCPVGYYSRYYSFGASLRFGVYGWAGGSWGGMADWTFCPTRSLRHRNLRDSCGRGRDFAGRGGVLDRGLVTTDTRGVTPDLFDRPQDIVTRLHRGAIRTRAAAGGAGGAGGVGGGELPDVNDFVARRRDLPVDLARGVAGPGGQGLFSGGREPWSGNSGNAGNAGSGDSPVTDGRAVRPIDRGARVDRVDRVDRSDRTQDDAAVGTQRNSGREPWLVDRRARSVRSDGVEPYSAPPTVNEPVDRTPAPVVRSRGAGDGGTEPYVRDVRDVRQIRPQPGGASGAGGREPAATVPAQPAPSANDWRNRDRAVISPPGPQSRPSEPMVRGGSAGGSGGSAVRRGDPQPRAVDRDDPPAVRRVVDGVRSSRVRSNPQPPPPPPAVSEPPARKQGDSGREPASRPSRQGDAGRDRSGGRRGGGSSGDSGQRGDPPHGG